MNKLVSIDGKKAFTTSKVIAEGCGVEHVSVMTLVRKYSKELNGVSSCRFQIDKFKTGGRTGEMAVLDEHQATLLLTLMKNSEIVVKFKTNLVKEFYKQRDTLSRIAAQHNDPNWKNPRSIGIEVVKRKHDVIKQFIEYATNQGSTSANKYYVALANMENGALFILNDQFHNVREVADSMQLVTLAVADDLIEKTIREGMDNSLNYKDIYKLAKERLISLANLIGKTPIYSMLENKTT